MVASHVHNLHVGPSGKKLVEQCVQLLRMSHPMLQSQVPPSLEDAVLPSPMQFPCPPHTPNALCVPRCETVGQTWGVDNRNQSNQTRNQSNQIQKAPTKSKKHQQDPTTHDPQTHDHKPKHFSYLFKPGQASQMEPWRPGKHLVHSYPVRWSRQWSQFTPP